MIGMSGGLMGPTLIVLLTKQSAASSGPPYCLSHGWSIVTTASTTSTFAGVLAGFVFLGVATLITQKDARVPQALGLLSCAFVVLGFDSYLFGLVAGNEADTDCARVWTEGLPTSGLLAVGGLAVVTGISWLVAVRDRSMSDIENAKNAAVEISNRAGEPVPETSVDPGLRLDRLSRVVAVLAAVGVALLLVSTTLDYGAFAFGGRERFRMDVLAFTSLGVVIVATLVLSAYRYRHKSFRVPAVAYWMSSYGIVIYALACTVFVGYITNTASAGESFIDVIAAVLGSIAPAILLVGLVQSIAPRPVAISQPQTTGHMPPGEALPVDSELRKRA